MNSFVPGLEKTEMGSIQIAPEVVAIIAGKATMEIDGVYGMSGSGISELLGRKNLTKGVNVEVGEKQTAVDVSVIIEYGQSIPELSRKIQTNVKQAIESMTGLEVVEVNVHINDVHFHDLERQDEETGFIKLRK